MRDAFYEESAISQRGASEAKKYTVLHVISIICCVLAALHAFFSLTFVPKIINDCKTQGVGAGAMAFQLIWWFLPLIMLVGMFFFFWKWKKRYNVSYDYTFVEDELRISKVFNGKRRKFIITLKADQILKIGLCENDSFERTVSGNQKKVRYMTPNREPSEDKSMVYVLYSSFIEKSVYVIECRKQLLEYLVLAAGRNKWEAR